VQRALLILLIAASYLLFAGGPRWTALPLLLIAGAAVLVAPRRTLSFPRADRVLDWSILGLVGAILLQLVPLPAGVVGLLSPRAEAVRSALGVTSVFSDPRTWRPLSVASTATLDALGTVVLAAMSFWAARAICSSRHGTRRVCQALAVMAGLAAIVAMLHRQSAPRLVFGVLAPETPSATPFGAFVNRNHFAAWLLMAAVPVVGYLLAHVRVHPAYQRSWKRAVREGLQTGSLFIAAGAIIAIGTLFLTLSRSALTGLGVAVVTGYVIGRLRLSAGRRALPFLLGLIGAAGLVLVLFVDVDQWAARINSTFDATPAGGSRLTIWRETLPMLRDFALTGTGAGTFSEAMLVYQKSRIWVGSMQRWAHFNNAHSHYLQVAVEGGILVGLPVAIGLLSLVRRSWRAVTTDRSEIFWIRAGAAAALAGIAVQSIWEIPLAMPANAVLGATLVAMVIHDRPTLKGDIRTPTPGSL
jgi:O-antigen ligase